MDATGRYPTGGDAGGSSSSGASAGSFVGAGGNSGSGASASPRGGTTGKTYPAAGTSALGGLESPNSGGAAAQAAGAAGAESGAGGASPDPDSDSGPLPDLPNDQPNSPVQGDVSFVEATYSGDPSFEVLTPTARYVVLRDRGVIISISDVLSPRGVQWLGYSDYRPRRVAGIVARDGRPDVVTTVDTESVTARHVRLRSESATGDWLWTWDFYATQATLTVSRAATKLGFTYRGTPGGQLDDGDRLVLASGEAHSAENSLYEALPGAAAWLYLADPALGHSLFLIQHGRDELSDRYDSLDGDSAAFMFGDGELGNVPLRFSLGLVDSTNHATVRQRAEFVIAAVQ